MKNFKVNELYILKPMKLVRVDKKRVFPFPTNMLVALKRTPIFNLEQDLLSGLGYYKFHSVDEDVYGKAKTAIKEEFVHFAGSTTLGSKIDEDKYLDIFDEQVYPVHYPHRKYESEHYNFLENNLTINGYDIEFLKSYIHFQECEKNNKHFLDNYSESMRRIEDTTLSKEELLTLREKLVSDDKNETLVFSQKRIY